MGGQPPEPRPNPKGESAQPQQRPPAKDAYDRPITKEAADKAAADKAAADKAAADNSAAGKAAADKIAADKVAADKVAADKVAADKVAADKAAADKVIADKAAADALAPAQVMQNATPLQAGAYAPVSAMKTANPMAPQAPTASMPQQAPAGMNKPVVAAAAAAQANKTSTGANQFTTPSLNGITFGGN